MYDSAQQTRPTPDPTILTTEQLLREIDRAIKLLTSEIKGDQETNEVRFKGIEREFALTEDRRKEQKVDTKVAVDAALQAAEKAVKEQTVASEKSITKSETSAAEQSKQQYATFSASLKGVSDTLADVKDRVNKIEASKVGALEIRNTQRLDMGTIIAVIAIAITIITFLTR
jgi:hypothetical protein